MGSAADELGVGGEGADDVTAKYTTTVSTQPFLFLTVDVCVALIVDYMMCHTAIVVDSSAAVVQRRIGGQCHPASAYLHVFGKI